VQAITPAFRPPTTWNRHGTAKLLVVVLRTAFRKSAHREPTFQTRKRTIGLPRHLVILRKVLAMYIFETSVHLFLIIIKGTLAHQIQPGLVKSTVWANRKFTLSDKINIAELDLILLNPS
jgi:hypothetical protein